MVRLHSPRHHAKRFARATALLSLAFSVAVPVEKIWGSPTEDDSQQQVFLPSVADEPFSGEIQYDFDTVLNLTKARFQASLDAHGGFGRIFFSTPAVHTVIATYEFAGRSLNHVPDSVRMSFVSDEYVEQTQEERGALPTLRPILELNLGHVLASYGIAVAQRTESRSAESVVPDRHLPTENHIVQQMPPTRQVRTSRTATSLFSICEFLALISEQDVKGTVAGLDFAMNHRVIAGLRAFASEMKPNDVGAANVNCGGRN